MEAFLRMLGLGQLVDDLKWFKDKLRAARIEAEARLDDGQAAIESDTNGRLHRKAVAK